MTLQEFLDRLADNRPTYQMADVLDEAKVAEANAYMGEVYGRAAERAGLDLGEVQAAAIAHMAAPTVAVITKVLGTHELKANLHTGMSSAWHDGFLTGVLWEQERNMPNLDL